MGILKGRVRQLRLNSKGAKKEDKSKYHWGAIVVVVIIVVAFVVAPVIPSFLGGKVYSFGSYKGVPIRFYPGSEMERNVSSLMREIPSQAQGAYRQFYYQQIWYEAFMRQAMHLAISERLRQAGLLISQEKINELLKAYPGFLDDRGEFDLNIYKRYSAQQKADICSHLEESYLWQHYEKDVLEMPISRSFFNSLKELAQTQLSLSWVKFSKEDIPLNDLQAFVKKKGNLLCASDLVVLVANNKNREVKKFLDELKNEDLSLEEINPEQKEDFEGALFYEIANLVRESDREQLLKEFQSGEMWTSVYPLSDGRFGFFCLKKPFHYPDLSQSVEKNKVILYMQMEERDFYEELLRNFAQSHYNKRAKSIDKVSFNPSGCSLYSTDMGGLANFAGNESFYKSVFSLKVGERTQPFFLADDVYIFELLSRINQSSLEEEAVKGAFRKELLFSLQEDLLNTKDFKNNFWEVYHKSGIAELVASQV